MVRAWSEKDYGKRVKMWTESLQIMLDSLVMSLGESGAFGVPHKVVPVWLRMPPWRASWTFGVPTEVKRIHIRTRMHIRTHADIHLFIHICDQACAYVRSWMQTRTYV